MPAVLAPAAAKAIERHRLRHANPGVAVELSKSPGTYDVVSPHNNRGAWQAMICDALGTRSESTARTFLLQLTELCGKVWHPADADGQGGEWYPDETELNMVLNMVAGIRPANEMQAALAAQMVAVHLMTMKAAAQAMQGCGMDERTAAIAGKLARTFVMQTDALGKMKGRKTSRQKITVAYEKHEHKHVHVHRGEDGNGGQSHATDRAGKPAFRAALPSSDETGNVMLLPCGEREARLPNARRKVGRSDG